MNRIVWVSVGRIPCQCFSLATSLVFTLGAVGGYAQSESDRPVSSEEITRALTRGITVGSRGDSSRADDRELEASPFVSLTAVQFDLDSDALHPSSKVQLEQVVRALQTPELRHARILIEGHTCSLGDATHNLALSRSRAEAVRAYLLQEGIEPSQLAIGAWGESRPVASNTNEEGRRLNRRVDFVRRMDDSDLQRLESGVRTRGISEGPLISAEIIQGGTSKAGVAASNSEVTLESGDSFQLRLQVFRGCHIYVLFRGSEGDVNWLMPTELEEHKNGRWLYVNQTIVLPTPTSYYSLDDEPGTELFYIVASAGPLERAEGLAEIFKDASRDTLAQSVRGSLESSGAYVKVLTIHHSR